ncbi:serine protease inhibitor A3M-like [Tachyglossus aculeatus]|uniref:serine protease inhibitor A3M-like n=1 Tax=Tachyglossus aculeatus TaxID=9261 RepID=UPI0018F7782A|nr:serine protease inhibitor A3M-like [Tachyglossus aculeatus]
MQYPLCFQPTSSGLWAILCLVFGATVVSCGYPCHDVGPPDVNFMFKLYHRLTSKSPSHNILYSPVDISSALVTLSLGARSNTQTQILEGLQFNLTEISEDEILRGYQCIQINLNLPGMWPDTKLGSALFVAPGALPSPDFIDEAADIFGSEIIYADFQDPEEAKHQIDEYIKEQTLDRIKNAIPSLDDYTSPVLVSTPFIKGQWVFPFDASQTIDEMDFFVDDGTVVKVPVMYQKGQFLIYRDEEVACTTVHKEFVTSSGVYFILPDEGKMKQVEEAMSGELLLKWFYNSVPSDFELYVPKFSLSATYDLEEILSDIGIEDLFTQRADLSGLTNQSGAAVSKVRHSATLEVEEDGLIAAGSTGIVVSSGPAHTLPAPSHRSPPVHSEGTTMTFQSPILFNRPFLIGVFHGRAYTTLFWGKVVNPALRRDERMVMVDGPCQFVASRQRDCNVLGAKVSVSLGSSLSWLMVNQHSHGSKDNSTISSGYHWIKELLLSCYCEI